MNCCINPPRMKLLVFLAVHSVPYKWTSDVVLRAVSCVTVCFLVLFKYPLNLHAQHSNTGIRYEILNSV